jgi:hypothetical protein
MSVEVRVATPADIPLILRFVRDLAEYERLLHEVEMTEADLRRDLFGENPRAFCDIAEHKGEPVGFALWFYNYSTFRGRAGSTWRTCSSSRGARRRGRQGAAAPAGAAVRGRRPGAAGVGGAELERALDRLLRQPGRLGEDDWTVRRLDGEALSALAAS